WRLQAPALPDGPTRAAELAGLGVEVRDSDSEIEVIAVMSRIPIDEAEIGRMRHNASTRATALLGLQNDAFLERVPEAAVTISAADATPLARRAVARALVAAARAPRS